MSKKNSTSAERKNGFFFLRRFSPVKNVNFFFYFQNHVFLLFNSNSRVNLSNGMGWVVRCEEPNTFNRARVANGVWSNSI